MEILFFHFIWLTCVFSLCYNKTVKNERIPKKNERKPKRFLGKIKKHAQKSRKRNIIKEEIKRRKK